MDIDRDLALWVGGLLLAGLLGHFISARLRPDLRARRKRHRNYGRVIAKARRPVVMLNVKTR